MKKEYRGLGEPIEFPNPLHRSKKVVKSKSHKKIRKNNQKKIRKFQTKGEDLF